MRVSVKLTVLPGNTHAHVQTPHFLTSAPSSAVAPAAAETYYATTGVGPDLLEAARDAARAMVRTLQAQHGLSREEAYMLCSVAGDLRLHEVVDMPNFVVRGGAGGGGNADGADRAGRDDDAAEHLWARAARGLGTGFRDVLGRLAAVYDVLCVLEYTGRTCSKLQKNRKLLIARHHWEPGHQCTSISVLARERRLPR
jgi:hypothetical protein